MGFNSAFRGSARPSIHPFIQPPHLGTNSVSKISQCQKCAYTFVIFMSIHLSIHPLIHPSIHPPIQPPANSFIHSFIQ